MALYSFSEGNEARQPGDEKMKYAIKVYNLDGTFADYSRHVDGRIRFHKSLNEANSRIAEVAKATAQPVSRFKIGCFKNVSR